MSNVINMFTRKPTPNQPFVLEDVLTEEMDDEFHATGFAIRALWETTSEHEFSVLLNSIKERVAGWPSG